MIRCRTCVMPNTRPDVPFIDGECQACINYRRRPAIDWDARKRELLALLDRHDGRCIVPSSGGKDSHYQVLTLLELGADVTIVTARTCHLTALGRANIDNLSLHARTYEVVPNMAVRARLNRMGLELVGDISWPEHVSIFTTPFRMAQDLGIALIFYGENPQDQYGGPQGSEQARQLTQRWRSEFGGFLGLRPDDLVGQQGLTKRDLADYQPPGILATTNGEEIEAHFLGQYLPWDSNENAKAAILGGMQFALPATANWWRAENLDNAQTGLHDYFGWLKYGYGRGCAQISVDVRGGIVPRASALAWIRNHDHLFPDQYAGVDMGAVIERIGLSTEDLAKSIQRFTNRDLFDFTKDGPQLKDWVC